MQFEAATEGEKVTKLELMSFHLRTLIQEHKSQTREMCIFVLDGAFKHKSSSQLEESFQNYGGETMFFMVFIQKNLEALGSNLDLSALVKQQIASVDCKLGLFRTFVWEISNVPSKYEGAFIGCMVLRLWIAEGFVKANEMQCLEHLAREYLDYLVSQNLVLATERGSMGQIKFCNVHDLLYDLCFQKAMEDNILHLIDPMNVIDETCTTIGFAFAAAIQLSAAKHPIQP
ncbi:OLC1v1012642C1 [Oldenlandia corymbosa var. corymbosa]|uniref:OLC1v1012642C1 n=1 Tax=Oldenlandia corymbosa var. corymbosa TaxID=529605 RepID=A0AAV1DWF6_OLDCO|nr:OLC1v1012642C1 [Oldenlandia corymbosa var. corymbosa]